MCRGHYGSVCSEPPDIEVRVIPTEADASVGYLVIAIPPSPRAPHMVTIREDNRYYGRSAKGNVRLTEGDVARLYERRQRWETDRKALLDEAIARAPITPDEGYAYLHLVARPVVPDENLLDRAMGSQHVANFLDGLFAAALEDEVWPRHEGGKHFEPDLTLDNRWFWRAEGWRTVQGLRPNFALFEEPGLVLDTEIGMNGTGWLFCGGAAERMQSGELWLFEDLVAGLTSRFLRVLGGLYAAGAYVGPVDAGLAVTGVEGAVSSHLGRHPVRKYRRQLYDRDVYRRTARFPAAALRDDPHGSARELVSFLTRAITAEQYDPFSD